jgi:pyruvate,orthophosphate dikinase
MDEVRKSMARLEALSGRRFGDAANPLLVSVRSGAAASMPGMLDTILNLGLNEEIVRGLAQLTSNPLFAWDTYRRFLQMFGKVVLGIDEKVFDTKAEGTDLADPGSVKLLAHSFENNIIEQSGRRFPREPYKQLELAIEAVFNSWTGRRASEYRKRYGITSSMANGTAVSIVSMVYGNKGNDSGTGVVSTRNPDNGDKTLYGDYLLNAQGEDVVSGKTNPKHIDLLETEMPVVFQKLQTVCQELENHFHEPQDIEFTIEQGRLFILQTRAARMSALASVKTSVDMFHEGLLSKTTAVERLNPEALEQILYPRIDPHHTEKPLATGVGASPGAVSGLAIFDVEKAEMLGRRGEKVILVREETKPDDVPAFFQAAGIMTIRGGKTSHAAVVARGMGKPCVVGCSQVEIDHANARVSTSDNLRRIAEGDRITIDGSTGRVFAGEIRTVDTEITSELREILQWSTEMKGIKVRANADTPESAAVARKFGAEGIGLCRTERMFSQHERIAQIVHIIMAESEDERRAALRELEPLQRADFRAILKEMRGLPVTIRLLDPPLHEFLPDEDELIQQIYEMKSSRVSTDEISQRERVLKRVKELSEINPMLGHRGVRMGISFPEIYESQIRAICEAAADLEAEGIIVEPQIMVPQVAIVEELGFVRQIFETVRRDVENRRKTRLKISFGSMIEVVRSCLIADDLSQFSDFLSFGTNDLTQATFSFSREDVESKFLPLYVDKAIMSTDPFDTIDERGVGRLMRLAVDLSRKVKKDIEIGICGEHGGDPKSIEFCSSAGLDYVSASAHRIPIAIISAAQSAIKENKRHSLLKA